jgi:hypothetical protein
MEEDEEVDYSKREVFLMRTKAASIVFSNMSAAIKEEVLKKVDHYKKDGLPEDVQKQ